MDTGDEHAPGTSPPREALAADRIRRAMAEATECGVDGLERFALVLEAFLANPEAFGDVAEVLAGGGVKHGGGLGPDDVQTVGDHVAAATRHLHAPWVLDVDPDTGLPTLAHVGGRCILAMTRARRAGAGTP